MPRSHTANAPDDPRHNPPIPCSLAERGLPSTPLWLRPVMRPMSRPVLRPVLRPDVMLLWRRRGALSAGLRHAAANQINGNSGSHVGEPSNAAVALKEVGLLDRESQAR